MKLVNTINDFVKRRKPIRIVILKARQIGFSTVIEIYILWRQVRGDGVYRAVEIADDKGAAKDILEINRFAINNFPDWFKIAAGFETSYFSKYELGFARTGGVLSVTSSDSNQPGRSRTIHLLHLSECAFYNSDNAKKMLKAIMPALSKSPRSAAFAESTGNGPSGWFYDLYQRAKAGKNEYVPLFFPWYEHDEYRMPVPEGVEVYCPPELEPLREQGFITDEQLYWRRWCIENDMNGDEDAFRVEYPTTEDEAFLLQSATLFDKMALYHRMKELEGKTYETGYLVDGESGIEFKLGEGNLHVFQRPASGRVYVIGSDVGSGVAMNDGDPSSADVLDAATGEQVAHYHAIEEPVPFGQALRLLGKWYNNAMIAPEITGGHGMSTINALRDSGYTNIYHRKVFDKIQKQWVDRIGWNTSQSTRKMMIDNLRTDFHDGLVSVNEIATLEEMGGFSRNQSTGKYEAAGGGKDDRVLSLGISNQVRKEVALIITPQVQQQLKEHIEEVVAGVQGNTIADAIRRRFRSPRGTSVEGLPRAYV